MALFKSLPSVLYLTLSTVPLGFQKMFISLKGGWHTPFVEAKSLKVWWLYAILFAFIFFQQYLTEHGRIT